MPLPQLRRIRWAVRATLMLGVAASVAANILHARNNPISQIIAAWPPLALLLTIELISRIPVHRRSLAAVRLASTATIAGIAAWVSYWHMVGVAARYGETGPSPYLLPLSVDGLVLVASVSLVELGGRIRADEQPAAGSEGVDATVDDRRPTAAAAAVTQPRPVRRRRPARTARRRTWKRRRPVPTAGGRGGRRPATVDDARRVMGKRSDISRDALATLLREEGLSVSTDRAKEMRDELRGGQPAAGVDEAAAADGRVLQPV